MNIANTFLVQTNTCEQIKMYSLSRFVGKDNFNKPIQLDRALQTRRIGIKQERGKYEDQPKSVWAMYVPLEGTEFTRIHSDYIV